MLKTNYSNHAVNVTQKHVSATYSVAACLSRLADTEWQKSCECIRRFSPTIGPLGQWRTLCEGGWTGPIPADLPDLKASSELSGSQQDAKATGLKVIEEETRQPPPTASPAMLTSEPREYLEQPRIPPPGYSSGPPSASASSHNLLKDQAVSHNFPNPTRQQQSGAIQDSSVQSGSTTTQSNTLEPLEPPRAPFVDTVTGSVRSLSAFPAPPNHFPLPPPRSQQSSHSQSAPSSNLDFPSHSQFAESPISANEDNPGSNSFEESFSRTNDRGSRGSPISPPSPEIAYRERQARIAEERNREQYGDSTGLDGRHPIPVRSQTSLPSNSTYESSREKPSLHREVRHMPSSSADFKFKNNLQTRENFDHEFEVGNRTEETKLRTSANIKQPRLERMDTGESSGSIVAAMRNRYSSNVCFLIFDSLRYLMLDAMFSAWFCVSST